MKLIVSDTTALIILAKTDNLHLLTNFVNVVYVPKAVMDEIEFKNDKVKNIIQKSSFIQVKKLSDVILDDVLNSNLDIGEIEAISLALETNLSLIIDEKLGRKFAQSKGINIIGLLGILKANLLKNHISYTDVLYILDEFKSVDFRISSKLEKSFLEDMLNLKNNL